MRQSLSNGREGGVLADSGARGCLVALLSVARGYPLALLFFARGYPLALPGPDGRFFFNWRMAVASSIAS